MPEKEASLFVKLVVENHGTLSKAKRSRFVELSDELVEQLEAIVRKHMLGR
jgi:hypothetical protein